MKTLIPSIADLALQYGTIDKDQFIRMESRPKNKDQAGIQDEVQFLLAQKWATQYQIELLVLLRNYHIVRKTGEEFGQIVLEKGFASKQDIKKARKFQKEEFKRLRKRKFIGEILLEKQIITEEQRDMILQTQASFAQESKEILHVESQDDTQILGRYESQFLQAKTLEREFAAKVVQQGFATREQIQKACREQKHQRAGGRKITPLDQILLDMHLISSGQRDLVLTHQRAMTKAGKKIMSDKPEEPSVEISVLHGEMIAMVVIPPKLLAQIFPDQTNSIHIILNQIKQMAIDKKITSGIYWDSLLFCHLQNRSARFFLACQDYSAELILGRQAHFLLENALEKAKEIQRGTALTRETVSGESYQKINIFGAQAPCVPELDCTFRPGPGARPALDGNGIVADRSGRAWVTLDRRVCVFPDLHVPEDMDQKYGPAPDAYADLFVSGMITGDYHVTAGNIRAREIRGADIVALGDIQVADGITDTVIRTQGSVHATYLHNCRIEAFGDICIKNEMIDCQIQCSGKIFSSSCRVVSSFVCAKQGVFVRRIGSERSVPCTICAGSEQHLVSHIQSIQEQIDLMELKMERIKEKIQRLTMLAGKTFRKMQNVKVFHDEAKKKKSAIEAQCAREKDKIDPAQKKNMALLISTFDSRMEQAVNMIKELHPAKKRIDKNIERLDCRLEEEKKVIVPEMNHLKQEMIALYQWARENESLCEIQCPERALKGTVFKGIYSQTTLEQDTENFTMTESVSNDPDDSDQPSSQALDLDIPRYHISLFPGTSLP